MIEFPRYDCCMGRYRHQDRVNQLALVLSAMPQRTCRTARLTVVVAGIVPIIGVSFAVGFALDSQVLVLKKRRWISQLESVT